LQRRRWWRQPWIMDSSSVEWSGSRRRYRNGNLQPLHRFNLCTHILTHIDYRVSLVSILFNRSHNFSSQFQFLSVSVTSPTKSPQLKCTYTIFEDVYFDSFKLF
jgi:hypothetical protein